MFDHSGAKRPPRSSVLPCLISLLSAFSILEFIRLLTIDAAKGFGMSGQSCRWPGSYETPVMKCIRDQGQRNNVQEQEGAMIKKSAGLVLIPAAILLCLGGSSVPIFNPVPCAAAGARALEHEGYVSPSFNLVKKVQHTLIQKGYQPGKVDGLWGPNTRAALNAFRRDQGLPENPYLTKEALDLLFAE